MWNDCADDWPFLNRGACLRGLLRMYSCSMEALGEAEEGRVLAKVRQMTVKAVMKGR